jgi:phosphatidylserine/phosphatidylglycerophosphate/cardiolipin synthase-like enzyme
MDDAELVAGVLIDAPDPVVAGQQLAAVLMDRPVATATTFDDHLIQVLRRRLGSDQARIDRACERGAAWVLGRRSVPEGEQWELVASLPTGMALPVGLRRTTGETLVQLVTGATRRIRMVSPFMDRPGLSFLGDTLAAATVRGVVLEVLLPTRSTHADEALADLRETIERGGDIRNFQVSRLRDDAPWAHLKVLAVDSIAAYIGSANVTGAGMAGSNLELGVLVRGPTVAVVGRVLDLFRQV